MDQRNNRVTLRYAHGWVHGHCDFDYYSAKFHRAQWFNGTVSVGLAGQIDYSFGTATTSR